MGRRDRKIIIALFANAFTYGLYITGMVPVLDLLKEHYPDRSVSLIQMTQTLPYASIIAGSLMLDWLTRHFTKKKIAVAGSLIVGLMGVLPFFADSFGFLLLTKALIGFGFGFVGPIVAAILTDFFEPEKRAGFMGIQVVGMGVGAMVSSFAGGYLARAGLRWFYLVYALAFVCAAIVQIFLPEVPVSEKQKEGHHKLTAMVFGLSAISFLFTMFINVYNTNLSLYITEIITSDPSVSGTAAAINSLVAMITGIFFSKIFHKMERKTLPAAVCAAAFGFAAILLIPNMAGVIFASVCAGFAISCFNAIGGFLISVAVEKDSVAMASSIFSVIGSLGGLISPPVMNVLSGKMGGNTPAVQFRIAFAGMLLTAAFVVLLTRRKEGP